MDDGSRTVMYAVSLKVPADTIEQLIESAGYGIGYWAVEAVVDDDNYTYTITDGEDGTTTVLTHTQLAEALVKVALDPSVNVNSTIRGYAQSWYEEEAAGDEYAAGHIDSDLADVVIQIAMFNEIKYG